jgi:hypothetical protein
MQLISDGEPLYLASEKGKSFRLIQEWKFKHDRYSSVLVVPQGYRSDLATIPPWIFWWQWGKWNIAAIAHDFIYENGYILAEQEDGLKPIFIDKKEADLIFYEICLFLGVPPITAKLMHWAVKYFGRGVWDKYS